MPSDAAPVGNGSQRFEDLRETVVQHDKRLSAMESTMSRLDERTASTDENVRAIREERRTDARDQSSFWMSVATLVFLVISMVWQHWPATSATRSAPQYQSAIMQPAAAAVTAPVPRPTAPVPRPVAPRRHPSPTRGKLLPSPPPY